MKIALVHDWLTGMRGGENCLQALLGIMPSADIFTLFHVPGSVSPEIEKRKITQSFIQHMPMKNRLYRHYLPLFPAAIERFDFCGYDMVVSLSHCVAKGAIAPPGVPHLCYIFTPMRYMWDMFDEYFGPHRAGRARRFAIGIMARYLRQWDVSSARRVNRYVAISKCVADRVRRHYRMKADVLYPPVDTDYFTPGGPDGDYYLMVTAFAPYKRLDLAVEAFARSGKKLIIAGDGQDFGRMSRFAPPNVEYRGWVPRDEVLRLMRGCRAFILPGEEDFGIAILEAQACGRPVIAYARGGALETVVDPGAGTAAPTGVLFTEATPESLVRAVEDLERDRSAFVPSKIREHALMFSKERFIRGFSRILLELKPPGAA